jgi:hypothetical protein
MVTSQSSQYAISGQADHQTEKWILLDSLDRKQQLNDGMPTLVSLWSKCHDLIGTEFEMTDLHNFDRTVVPAPFVSSKRSAHG